MKTPVPGKAGSYPGKRPMDVTVSFLLLVLLFPVLVLAAVAVRIVMGSPVLFRQERPGLGGRPFAIFKFRTMSDARGPDGELLPDGQRLTRLGRFLRKTSLDELPELWNVFRGDMSLVGPRPLLKEYIPYYTPAENQRHSVRPGITGLAQVSGRNHLTWNERLELDIHYIENISFSLDLKILLRTLAVVVGLKGVSPDSAAAGETRLDEERAGGRREHEDGSMTGDSGGVGGIH